MPIAELILDSSPSNFESFYFKATDQHTSLVVLVASKDQFKALLESAGAAPGLYILQAEDSTVYVGKSVDLAARLRNHKTNDKIGYRRVMVMRRDQGLARYLDYGEAKLYATLQDLGFRLEQTSLSGSLETKRQRLAQMDEAHVEMADGLVKQFLSYSVALGLTKPVESSFRTEPAFCGEVRTSQSATQALEPPYPVRVDAEPPLAPKVISEGPAKIAVSRPLCVICPDGQRIGEPTAIASFVRALEHAGLERVKALGLILAGEPLVGRQKSSKYPSASKESGGYFVMAHSSTTEKKRVLEKVSQALSLGWVVETSCDA